MLDVLAFMLLTKQKSLEWWWEDHMGPGEECWMVVVVKRTALVVDVPCSSTACIVTVHGERNGVGFRV
jgi:hypothetical protein